MHIKILYNITTFIENGFQYQMALSVVQKLQLCLHQLNIAHRSVGFFRIMQSISDMLKYIEVRKSQLR